MDSFAALFEQSIAEGDFGNEGEIVVGTIVAVNRDTVVVDIGGKSEGAIPLKEFKYGPNDSDDSVTGTRSITNLSSATNVVMMLFGPANGTNPVNIAIDNVRIVPE